MDRQCEEKTQKGYRIESTGKRPRDRPKNRRKDKIKEDMDNLVVTNWEV